MLFSVSDSGIGAFILLFLIVVLRAILRNRYLVLLAFALIVAFAFPSTGHSELWYVNLLGAVVIVGLFSYIVLSRGFLALLTTMVIYEILREFPMSLRFETWYAASSAFPWLVVGALALFGLRTATRGSPSGAVTLP